MTMGWLWPRGPELDQAIEAACARHNQVKKQQVEVLVAA